MAGTISLGFRRANPDLQLNAVRVSPGSDCGLHHKYLHAARVSLDLDCGFHHKHLRAKVGRLIGTVFLVEALVRGTDQP